MTKKLKIQTTEAESLTQTECYVSETRPNRGHDTNDDACSVNSVKRHLELEKNMNIIEEVEPMASSCHKDFLLLIHSELNEMI